MVLTACGKGGANTAPGSRPYRLKSVCLAFWYPFWRNGINNV